MADARVTRFTCEVLGSAPASAGVTRQGVQVALTKPGANSAANVLAARFGTEVLAAVPVRAGVTRQGVQVALTKPGANSAASMLAARFGTEVLARSFIPMTTFSVPATFELFLHNWAEASSLESAYSTDISAAAESLAEERTGLVQKPYRQLKVRWSAAGKAENNQMLIALRHLVDTTSVVPLYCDAVELTANSSASDTVVFGDFGSGRFFQNGPVVIVRLTPTEQADGATRVASWETAVVTTRFDDRLVLSSGLTAAGAAGRTLVMPLMQTHPQTAITFVQETNRVVTLSATFDEIYGPQALPPVASDLPSGFFSYRDLPILSPTSHQWSQGLEVEFLREGELSALGRGRQIYQRGERHRVAYSLRFEDYRAGIWPFVQFFDSRRGRLRSFWMIDPEDVFTVSLISGSFVSVSAQGQLADFQNEMSYIGLVFKDGTTAVRQATNIQLVAGAWRITIDSALPGGYTAADVLHFGRARLMRQDDDALNESWDTTNVCRLKVRIIELLAEGEVTP